MTKEDRKALRNLNKARRKWSISLIIAHEMNDKAISRVFKDLSLSTKSEEIRTKWNHIYDKNFEEYKKAFNHIYEIKKRRKHNVTRQW